MWFGFKSKESLFIDKLKIIKGGGGQISLSLLVLFA